MFFNNYHQYTPITHPPSEKEKYRDLKTKERGRGVFIYDRNINVYWGLLIADHPAGLERQR